MWEDIYWYGTQIKRHREPQCTDMLHYIQQKRDWSQLRSTQKLLYLGALTTLPHARVILSFFHFDNAENWTRALHMLKKHHVSELHLQLQTLNFFHPYLADIDIQQSPKQAVMHQVSMICRDFMM